MAEYRPSAVVFAKEIDGKYGKFVSAEGAVNLQDIIDEVGPVVDIICSTPRNPKGPESRIFSFRKTDPKYLRSRTNNQQQQPNRNEASHNDVV